MNNDDWIDNSKFRAKAEATYFVGDMEKIASDLDVDSAWFIEEVIKNIHKLIGDKK